MQLSLMSYNIKSGLWTGRGLEAVAEVIAGAKPDVVALQEVDRHMERSGGIDQANWLGERLGYQAVFAAATSGADFGSARGEYGIAVLSRRPIREHERRLLYRPSYPEAAEMAWASEQRCILGCAVEFEGTLLDIFCTHFGLTADQRLRQAREAADFVTGWHPGRPAVLMGDFNALPDDPEIGILRSALIDLFQQCGLTGDERLTFPSGSLGSRTEDGWAGGIDYVFLTSHFDQGKVEVIRETSPASDHAPVVARVALSSG